ncbi:MAG: hypoxanthine phosphoribosyltransferase [Saprospiraceae bacterium]
MEKTILVKDKYFKKFISKATIEARIKEIVLEMATVYAKKNPLFIAVLNGSFMVASDIMKAIDFDAEITFIKLASYENMASTGEVNTLIGLKGGLEGRDVIIIEDIIDSGRTMHHFLPSLEAKNPQSIAIFTLLHKPSATIFDLDIDYVGFSIEDKFVIGYGLDYDQAGRHYGDIYQLA